jgi:hypothetical protein
MGVVRCCGADARATRDYGRMRGRMCACERVCMCEVGWRVRRETTLT